MLRSMRISSGFTQEQLAMKLNLSQSCISKFEANLKVPSYPQLLYWAHVTDSNEIVINHIKNSEFKSL
ncbi:helix-turn-helix domain-containing protein [Alkalicoccobacillus gibsonii]|uniref:helix-turn-helix domain-containing protein n=1 Tax=Alkalicoccobacillus gibsonii TaxID=79881 RepID=UPI003F7CB8D2